MDELLDALYINPDTVTVRITPAKYRHWGDYDMTPTTRVYSRELGDFVGCSTVDFERLVELFGPTTMLEVDREGHAERSVASAWLTGEDPMQAPRP